MGWIRPSWAWRLATVSSLCLFAGESAAQLAPTGNHYGGRPGDGGFASGQVTTAGTFTAEVPLDLPAARGGIPIPVHVVHGGGDLGAAGVGWDVPLSYVRRTSDFARRRPGYRAEHTSEQPPIAREEVVLVLDGRTIPLADAGSVWLAQRDAPGFVVEEVVDGWTLVDDDGRLFHFADQGVGSGELWYLDRIEDADGTVLMELHYVAPTVVANGGTARWVDLERVAYNAHPTTAGCFKNEILLDYTDPASAPLSLEPLGADEMVGRARVLETVSVGARASCGSPETLRRYELAYAPGGDADTHLPRLASVTMRGRDGVATTPIAAYGYGTATNAGALGFDLGWPVTLPGGANVDQIASTSIDNDVSVPGGGQASVTWQSLTDFTGDGRPDLVFRDGTSDDLVLAVNRPGTQGALALGPNAATVVPLTGGDLPPGPLEILSSDAPRFPETLNGPKVDYVWRQMIDVNADGRIDIVDAREEEDAWAIYLNTPGATANDVVWVRRLVSNQAVRDELEDDGFEPMVDDHLPLARRFTWRDRQWQVCYWRTEDGWEPYPNGCPTDPPTDSGEVTLTDWHLADLNGDGYPDLVKNGAPVDGTVTGAPGEDYDYEYYLPRVFTLTRHVAPLDGPYNQVEVMLNGAGIRAQDFSPFAASIPVATQECGVEMWRSETNYLGVSTQQLSCGFVEVNGDHIPDRVTTIWAYLGSGTAYAPVRIQLPGAAAEQASNYVDVCLDPQNPHPFSSFFHGWIQRGLRDVTGDGIPDYLFVDDDGWQVAVGTGAGFAPPIPIEAEGLSGFSISSQREQCNGAVSETTGGLFDLDSDGKPELVFADGTGMFSLHRISGGGTSERALDAGRLVSIDDGHGSRTRATYFSAKDDQATAHQVPFSEIVVTAVDTVGLHGLGGTLAATRYAYGDARLIYDGARDAFVMPAYGRSVVLASVAASGEGAGVATITETAGLPAYVFNAPADENLRRYLLAGKVRDVTTLAGILPADPWTLLWTDTATDPRVSGVTHLEYGLRGFPEALPAGASQLDCMDLRFPYDYGSSVAPGVLAGYDMCSGHAFSWVSSTESWRGTDAPPSTDNVLTRSETREVDDRGRVLAVAELGDVRRFDDDVCVDVKYANPTGTTRAVRTAVMSRHVRNCDKPRTYLLETFEYDGFAPGTVGLGRNTARTTERHATDDGALLGTVREIDVLHDAMGNPVEMVSVREDGVERTVGVAYDAFGLVPVWSYTRGSDTPPQEASVEVDPVSLETVAVLDPNGTERSVAYDPFGRIVRHMVRTPEMTKRQTVETSTYLGFDVDDPAGRRVETTRYADPVPDGVSVAGQTSLVHLDELGRVRLEESRLGADYGGESLLRETTYDAVGRVLFASDPHPGSESAQTAYGTTYHFDHRGDPACTIRGSGVQPLTNVVDEASERFPRCFQHYFASGTEVVAVQEADALVSTAPQAGVTRYETRTALGRLMERATWKGNARLEVATFEHDVMGTLSAVVRYGAPATYGNPVRWASRNDALGRRIRLDEAGAPSRFYEFDDFGDATAEHWVDTTFGAHERRSVTERDGLGRPTRSVELWDGVPDPVTEMTYAYDVPVAVGPEVTPRYTMGRLAVATSPTVETYLSYDAFGRPEARTFKDLVGGEQYVETSVLHFDGAPEKLSFHLPDRGMDEEKVKYEYDSARRPLTVDYDDGGSFRRLFEAQTTDVFGRVRKALYDGTTHLDADHADTGRRLPLSTAVYAPGGSREHLYLGFDPRGRMKSHREIDDGANAGLGAKTNVGYDALGRILNSRRTGIASQLTDDWFDHDALGNLQVIGDAIGNLDATMSFQTVDRDRLCRVGYGAGGLGGSACNVVHDGVGNVLQLPVRGGQTRDLEYFVSGRVRVMAQGNQKAVFDYDALGGLSRIETTDGSSADAIVERHFGDRITVEDRSVDGNKPAPVIVRHIPGPGGEVASLRGKGGAWYFTFGDARGNRFVVDKDGKLVQDMRYQPYGETIASGAEPLDLDHEPRQWNGGTALEGFGVVLLGARVYDPVIGRFLSRDPLGVLRTSAKSNPYAFANGDPVNHSDPTGLDCIGGECNGPGGGGPSVPDGGPRDINWDQLHNYFPGTAPTRNQSHARKYVAPPAVRYPNRPRISMSHTYDDAEQEAYEKGMLDSLVYSIIHYPPAFNFAATHKNAGDLAVLKYRHDHRFDGLTPSEYLAAKGDEAGAIFQANQRRAVLHGNYDRDLWQGVANITGPLVDEDTFEVWMHGSAYDLSRQVIGPDGSKQWEMILPPEVFAALENMGARPGDKFALIACGTGFIRDEGVSLFYAQKSGSLVFGTKGPVWAMPGYPAVVPDGMRKFRPPSN